MSHHTWNRHRRTAFSITDLSAVMASIAVVAAVAVPAVSRLGGHQRTTVCLSRIGMMTTAFLIYAQDYDGVFPFVSTMHESDVPDPNEVWLANWLDSQNPLDAISSVAYCPQEDWYFSELDVPRSGTLFPYALYEQIYRCPEFERVSHPDKAQNVFNYTRAAWGRLYRLPMEYEMSGGVSPKDWGGVDGPIQRVADIHKPSELPMVHDEQWDRHVATAGIYGQNGSAYNCNDYGFWVENVIGIYHGAPVPSKYHDLDIAPGYVPFLWRQGSIGYYDGHAGLRRDPWPTYELGSGYEARLRQTPGEFRCQGQGKSGFDEVYAIVQYIQNLLYAQRGFDAVARYGQIPRPWGL